jgi:hypothetical protein
MSLFVEVFDQEKKCQVIINLDTLLEIAPKQRLENGRPVDDGCDLFFADGAAVGGKRAMKVRDSYAMFKQFAVEPITVDDISRKVKSLKSTQTLPFDVPKL